MKVISIWQPWASLIIHGYKLIETRSWKAPQSVIGTRIGIASTGSVRPEQRAAFADPLFRQYYEETGLPGLADLPHGCLLGTVFLNSCDLLDEEQIEDITEGEQSFGWFAGGRYAWRLRYPFAFDHPPIVKGAQGIWSWDPHGALEEVYERGH